MRPFLATFAVPARPSRTVALAYDPERQISVTTDGRPATDVHIADVTKLTASSESRDQIETTLDAAGPGMVTLITDSVEARDQSDAITVGAADDVTMVTKTHEARDASEGGSLFMGTLRTDGNNPEQSDPSDLGWA